MAQLHRKIPTHRAVAAPKALPPRAAQSLALQVLPRPLAPMTAISVPFVSRWSPTIQKFNPSNLYWAKSFLTWNGSATWAGRIPYPVPVHPQSPEHRLLAFKQQQGKFGFPWLSLSSTAAFCGFAVRHVDGWKIYEMPRPFTICRHSR